MSVTAIHDADVSICQSLQAVDFESRQAGAVLHRTGRGFFRRNMISPVEILQRNVVSNQVIRVLNHSSR
jgi:hypothetical protein